MIPALEVPAAETSSTEDRDGVLHELREATRQMAAVRQQCREVGRTLGLVARALQSSPRTLTGSAERPVLTLDDPDVRDALDFELVRGLVHALDDAQKKVESLRLAHRSLWLSTSFSERSAKATERLRAARGRTRK
jgi:hypothetical protein